PLAELLQELVARDLLVEQQGQLLLRPPGLVGGQGAGLDQTLQQRLRAAGPAALLDLLAREQAAADQGVGQAVLLDPRWQHLSLRGFRHGGPLLTKESTNFHTGSGRSRRRVLASRAGPLVV